MAVLIGPAAVGFLGFTVAAAAAAPDLDTLGGLTHFGAGGAIVMGVLWMVLNFLGKRVDKLSDKIDGMHSDNKRLHSDIATLRERLYRLDLDVRDAAGRTAHLTPELGVPAYIPEETTNRGRR